MAYRVLLQPRLSADIAEAFYYIAECGTRDAAVRWYRALRAEISSLSDMPSRCPIAPETAKLGIELRHLHFGKRSGVYRIVFRVVEAAQEVHVLTVRHGARKPIDMDDLA